MPSETKDRSYAIIGTGAVGGYYGSKLHHAGFDVRFLCRSDFDHIHQHGLRVESPDGDLSITHPQIYREAREIPPADVGLVAIKATGNHALPDILPHVVKEDGVVLMMQNGLGVEEQAAAVCPAGVRVLGGMAFLCCHKVGPGHVRHLDYGAVRLGQFRIDGEASGLTETLKTVGADLRKAGVAVELEADLVLARWKKLVWNVPYNGLCVVHRTTTDVLMGNPTTRHECETLMREVAAGAAAMGRTIGKDFIEKMLMDTDKMVAYRPSMLLDYEAGREMEVEPIYGEPLRAALSRGVALPSMERLYRRLTELNTAKTMMPAATIQPYDG